MPTISLTVTAAQATRILAALPPDYTGDLAGAKQFLIDCLKERVRAKEQADATAAALAAVTEPTALTVT